MTPATLSKQEFLALLAHIRDIVERDDSFGGHLEYEALPAPDMSFAVSCVYRTGNSEGQGCTSIVGRF